MRIAILIPCYNEEKSIQKSAQSWLNQTRPADQIIAINDCSKDRTQEILEGFGKQITVVRTPKNTGNKSSAQEYGLQFVDADVFIATDGDTLLHPDFLKYIEEDFLKDPKLVAVGGYVCSLKYNWLTACRALDYATGQNLDKLAQDYMNFLFVIPGAAGAFRTDFFRRMGFDHDVLAEDLDFTYKLHEQGAKIHYDRRAICYTQDPATLKSYINQMRRWYAGGWQCLKKHFKIPQSPSMALELTLIHGEGLVFSLVLFLLPIINLRLALVVLGLTIFVVVPMTIFGALMEKRADFFFIIPHYIFLKYVNAWIYLEQFTKEVILRKKNLTWFQPERVQM